MGINLEIRGSCFGTSLPTQSMAYKTAFLHEGISTHKKKFSDRLISHLDRTSHDLKPIQVKAETRKGLSLSLNNSHFVNMLSFRVNEAWFPSKLQHWVSLDALRGYFCQPCILWCFGIQKLLEVYLSQLRSPAIFYSSLFGQSLLVCQVNSVTFIHNALFTMQIVSKQLSICLAMITGK